MSRLTHSLASFTVFTFIVLAAVGPGDLHAEHVFLKDGRILNGAIVEDAARSITLKDDAGKTSTIEREDILRILYTKLKMGKIHVQMRDGKNFEAFIVDEDQESYTFRRELLKPDETTVNRTEVLFIAERNPSGLKGTPDTTRVKLTWYPPYNPVKHYLLYHKEQGEKDYQPAVMVNRPAFTLDGLKSNTVYLLKVTAVDDSNEESTPSNMLTVTTKNILPERPEMIDVVKSAPGADGKISATLQWRPAADPDGSIKGYRVFRKLEGKYLKIADINETTYTVLDLKPGRNTFGVCAVDNLGDESDITRTGTGILQYTAAVTGTYVQPMGRMSDLFKFGYGVTAIFMAENLFFVGFEPGIEAAYYRFTGAPQNADGADRDVKEGYMAPVLLRLGYGFGPFAGFSLSPYVAGGVSYNSVTYTDRFLVKVTKSAFEPAFSAGVSARYSPWATWYLYGDFRAMAIPENSPLYCIALSLGAGMKF
ncbi:MAG: hypothetical protein EPN93_09335 [Spirochaetes bacterium]|nr:MAG: hypothetical protein EPN93_09335 [Spirochaetota bacterium]